MLTQGVGGRENNAFVPYYQWWVKKFDSSGVEDTARWNKIASRYMADSTAYCVVVDPEGNIYVVGDDANDWAIKKYRGYGI
ncbi:MAG TPA: hypothetical protein PKN50_20445 [Spirochaetota bacterium]|mgnify:CR=1|nr:hypothetical protein [Spirochaetota bacterium]HPV43287.1 hypothetical protein [Spirochaetota bacterium]